MLGIKPRALHMQSKGSTTEPSMNIACDVYQYKKWI